MTGLRFRDRLPTIAATATITSAAWILYGTTLDIGPPQHSDASELPARAPAEVQFGGASGDPSTIRREAAQGGALLIPVEGVAPSELTDSFADGRAGGERVHEAIDIMAPKGTQVIAAAAGTVEKLFRSEDGGLTIYIRSPDRRTIYYYAHLARYADDLVEGQKVTAGKVIGAVGSSGNASESAPHLHFAVLRTDPDSEWWQPASAINPYPLLPRE